MPLRLLTSWPDELTFLKVCDRSLIPTSFNHLAQKCQPKRASSLILLTCRRRLASCDTLLLATGRDCRSGTRRDLVLEPDKVEVIENPEEADVGDLGCCDGDPEAAEDAAEVLGISQPAHVVGVGRHPRDALAETDAVVDAVKLEPQHDEVIQVLAQKEEEEGEGGQRQGNGIAALDDRVHQPRRDVLPVNSHANQRKLRKLEDVGDQSHHLAGIAALGKKADERPRAVPEPRVEQAAGNHDSVGRKVNGPSFLKLQSALGDAEELVLDLHNAKEEREGSSS